jgi:ribonuclease T1
MLKKYSWILLIATLLLVFWLGKQSAQQDESTANRPPTVSAPSNQPLPEVSTLPQSNRAPRSNELPNFLPPEAKTTLELIASNGPFHHHQDGVVFQNREQRLPKKARGYYHEYTVDTPGLDHRGARRIITGGTPIDIYYYTEDHYDSFREFEIQP